MNYCSKCGTTLLDRAKFCHKCGLKQNGLIDKIQKRISSEGNHEEVQTTRNKVKKYSKVEKTYTPIKVGILAVLATILVGFGSYYICSLTLSSSNRKEVDIYSKANNDSKSDMTTEPADKNQSEDSSAGNSTNEDNSKKSSTGTYIFANSGSKRLLDSNLSSLSKEQLALARNEIFARHGYVFETEPYKSYFKEKSWYKPNLNFKGNNEELNQVERYNIELISKYEKR